MQQNSLAEKRHSLDSEEQRHELYPKTRAQDEIDRAKGYIVADHEEVYNHPPFLRAELSDWLDHVPQMAAT